MEKLRKRAFEVTFEDMLCLPGWVQEGKPWVKVHSARSYLLLTCNLSLLIKQQVLLNN